MTLASPANLRLDPNPEAGRTADLLRFTWDPVPGADSYRVEVRHAGAISVLVVGGTQATVANLVANRRYDTQVVAVAHGTAESLPSQSLATCTRLPDVPAPTATMGNIPGIPTAVVTWDWRMLQMDESQVVQGVLVRMDGQGSRPVADASVKSGSFLDTGVAGPRDYLIELHCHIPVAPGGVNTASSKAASTSGALGALVMVDPASEALRRVRKHLLGF